MKPFKLFLLIGTLLLPHFQSKAEIVVVDSIKYEIHGFYTASARVVGYIEGIKDVIIQPVVYDCPTVEIADSAFLNCKTLKTISIPDNVNRIGYHAFHDCKNLTSIKLPKNLSSITWYSFWGCSSLESIEIPDGVTFIGTCAFLDCSSLTSIIIPESVNSIDFSAFGGCISLTSIKIPDRVDMIGRGTFQGCINLKSVIFPKDLKSIDERAFLNCTSLSSIVLPDKVESIEAEAFRGCNSVKVVSLPSSLKRIGYNAFGIDLFVNMHVSSVYIRGDRVPDFNIFQEVVSEETLVFVDSGLFEEYASSPGWKTVARHIYSDDMLEQKTVVLNADSERSALYSVLGDSAKYVANLKIKGSINGYDIMALRNKTTHLLYLDISEADIVANDDGYEYYSGQSLSKDNVLGARSFCETNLKEILLPKSLKRIEGYAFYYCYHLERVIIPDGVESIGIEAFCHCYNLKEAVLPKSLNELGESAFLHCLSLGPSLIIPDKVEVINANAFMGCTSVDSVRIGKKVSTIGDYAFSECSNIRHISFNRNLSEIGRNAFYGCSSLCSASLPYTVETIGNNAFYGCDDLKSIKIPSMLKVLGDRAFYECYNIDTVYTYTIEPTLIGQNAFSCYTTAILNVPKTSALLYEYNTQWSRFTHVREFEEPYDAFYLNGDYELTDSIGRLEGEPDAEMLSESGLIVYGTDTQVLNEVELIHDGKDGATIIGSADDLTGDKINLTAKSLNVNISVEGNRWYFFCFPFDVVSDSIECTSDHVWYSYDGKKRAAQGSGWDKIEADSLILQKGKGYIFKASHQGSLVIHVDSTYLTFTANNEKGTLITYNSNDVSNAHWNYIGNPFISYYDVQDLADEYDAPIVVWNGTGYDVYRPGDDNYQLKPFEAFFVQKEAGSSYVEFLPENRLTFNQAAAVSSLRVRRRVEMGTPMSLDRQLVNIVLMGQDSISDRTRIVYSTKASLDYEIGVDAAKFHTDGIPEIYTVNGTTKYAINERPMGTDDIKLGYIAPKAGTYTLSVPRHDAEIEIYDNDTHQTVDFTFGDYQFTSKAGTYNDRFVIHKTSGGVTAVDNGFRLDGITVTAFDGGIDIEGQFKGKVQIYSESGMLMAEPCEAGRVQLDGGVYIIKIADRSIKLNVNRGGYAL